MELIEFMKSYFSIFLVLNAVLLIVFYLKPDVIVKYMISSTKGILEFMGFSVVITQTPKAIRNIKIYFMFIFLVLLFFYSLTFRIF